MDTKKQRQQKASANFCTNDWMNGEQQHAARTHTHIHTYTVYETVHGGKLNLLWTEARIVGKSV